MVKAFSLCGWVLLLLPGCSSSDKRASSDMSVAQTADLSVSDLAPAGSLDLAPADLGQPDMAVTPLTFGTFPTAVQVIGQPDFTSMSPNDGNTGANASGFFQPYGNVLAGSSLYVSDDNNRLLIFDPFPTLRGAAAADVLGQSDFVTGTAAVPPTAASFRGFPSGPSCSGGRCAIADSQNNRVKIYNQLPTANANADVVVGQVDFTHNGNSVSASTLYLPFDAILSAGRLIVADTDNSRVLVWTHAPTANGAAADLVLGQADFVSGLNNRGGAPAANTLSRPRSVYSDGTRLAIADTSNNRILIWNTFPTTNGQPADLELGQPSFASVNPNSGADGLSGPIGMSAYGQQLLVSDTENARVLIFNSFPVSNHPSADQVLGQGDFLHTTENDDNQDGTPDAAPSARTLYRPTGAVGDAGRLIVTDTYNNRLLVFKP